MSKNGRKSVFRSMRGQGIVETVIGLVLLTAAGIGGMLLLINSGLMTLNKEKLVFVCNESARFAARQPDTANLEEVTSDFARDLMKKMALPADSAEIDTDKTHVGGQPAITVTIKGNIKLVHGVSYLPTQATLQESATAPLSSEEDGILAVRVYRQTSPLSTGSFNTWDLVYVPFTRTRPRGTMYCTVGYAWGPNSNAPQERQMFNNLVKGGFNTRPWD